MVVVEYLDTDTGQKATFSVNKNDEDPEVALVNIDFDPTINEETTPDKWDILRKLMIIFSGK